MNNTLSRTAHAALALVIAVVLAACGRTTESDTSSAAASASGPAAEGVRQALPQGWRRVAGPGVGEAEAGEPVLPASVRSDDGIDVSVKDVSRIIAGGDDVIAVLEALGQGDKVFAAPTNAVSAAGRQAPHRFLFNRTTGVEGVLSLGGSLFLGNSVRRHTALAAKLRAVGQDAVIVDDLQPAPEKVRRVAAAVGLAEAGKVLAAQVQAQLQEAAAIAADAPGEPRVIMISATGAGGAPTVAGADSAAGQLIGMAGGLNIGTEAGVANYSALSNEGVLAAAPQVILVTEQDLQTFGGADGIWSAYPTLKQTPAGEANRVWVMPDLQLKYLSVGSGAGALALSKALAELSAE
ncbi:ABC transporter substrate-binding protein [Stenotrophomonas sp. C3(2023)]|uniref:heme/hemin ABC transporter substrate-binding protein n=1 Tax=Stenotrophomonas sp. C3(2023) TaxID=3080277 RepID=UPI00293C7ED4|nr:ABC transporter substrate-binding protein [Stenotrophomonas sp. C3(2023)]MDV3468734.1 ABC transporter substrate-binding protein [Stenotrophomonas sp. C3(2023)]